MNPTLTGLHITLRPPKPTDKADRRALDRNPEIVRMFGGSASGLTPLTDAEIDAWYGQIDSEPHAWMIDYRGHCIGTARLHSLDQALHSARYAVGILDPTLLGKGLGREVTALVLAYAFETLKLGRVDLRVLAFNERAIRSYEASGFVRERVEHRAVEIDGVWHDDVVMAISRDAWLAAT